MITKIKPIIQNDPLRNIVKMGYSMNYSSQKKQAKKPPVVSQIVLQNFIDLCLIPKIIKYVIHNLTWAKNVD